MLKFHFPLTDDLVVWAIFHLSASKIRLLFLWSPTLGFPVSFMCPQSHRSWKLPSAFVFLPLPSLAYMAVIWGPMPLTLPFYILPLMSFLCPTTSTPDIDPILLMPKLEQRLFDSSPLLPPLTSLVSFPVWLICTLRMGLYLRALVSPEQTFSQCSIQILFFSKSKRSFLIFAICLWLEIWNSTLCRLLEVMLCRYVYFLWLLVD